MGSWVALSLGEPLVTDVRRLHNRAKTAIVSNAWPDMRNAITNAGLLDLTDTIVLPCEVGYAKTRPRIYAIAFQSNLPASTTDT